jgi:hypothetical protein
MNIKISSIHLRERFFALRKKPDETYMLLASKLHNALMYHLCGRNTTNFDKQVSLHCAHRMKELIPKSYLDFILAQDLARSIDTYMASHDVDGSPFKPGGSAFKRDRGRCRKTPRIIRCPYRATENNTTQPGVLHRPRPWQYCFRINKQ